MHETRSGLLCTSLEPPIQFPFLGGLASSWNSSSPPPQIDLLIRYNKIIDFVCKWSLFEDDAPLRSLYTCWYHTKSGIRQIWWHYISQEPPLISLNLSMGDAKLSPRWKLEYYVSICEDVLVIFNSVPRRRVGVRRIYIDRKWYRDEDRHKQCSSFKFSIWSTTKNTKRSRPTIYPFIFSPTSSPLLLTLSSYVPSVCFLFWNSCLEKN